jgi:hypothetical protein
LSFESTRKLANIWGAQVEGNTDLTVSQNFLFLLNRLDLNSKQFGFEIGIQN